MCTLWDFHVFVLLVRNGSELFGFLAETNSGIRISALLIYPTLGYCGYFWCAPNTTDSGIRILAFLIYPTIIYCGYFWCALFETFWYFYCYSGDGLNSLESQLRLTVVLGFLHSLYILPEVIVATCGVHLSETFRYLYSYSGEGLNSLESQLRLTVVLGFLHSLYILP